MRVVACETSGFLNQFFFDMRSLFMFVTEVRFLFLLSWGFRCVKGKVVVITKLKL